MKNYDILKQNIEEGLDYIKAQQQVMQPVINHLSKYLADNIHESGLSYKECFDVYLKLMEQETNSILVISKMQEVLTYCNKLKN